MESPDLLSCLQEEVHLWVRFFADPCTPEEVRAAEDQLGVEEKEILTGLRHPGRRDEFLRGRLLIRQSLSRYVPRPRDGWRFEFGSHGRPELVAGGDLPPLRFNLSHTRECMVCLVNLSDAAGVDVEHTDRVGKTVELADRFFTPREIRELRALPAAQQRTRFFRLWTLKEAYMKATGLGMALPLDQFGFHFEQDEVGGISFGPRIEGDPQAWSFHLHRLSPQHQAAVAVHRAGMPIRAFRWFLL